MKDGVAGGRQYRYENEFVGKVALADRLTCPRWRFWLALMRLFELRHCTRQCCENKTRARSDAGERNREKYEGNNLVEVVTSQFELQSKQMVRGERRRWIVRRDDREV